MTVIPAGLDAQRLAQLLTAAGVPHNGISLNGGGFATDPETGELEATPPQAFTHDAQGKLVDLPPGAAAVIAAYTPPPPVVIFQRGYPLGGTFRTVGTAPVEIYRLPFAPRMGARIDATLIAVDAANGAVRIRTVSIAGKRLLAGILQVGAAAVTVDQADAGTATWAVTPSIDATGGRNDFVVSVVGAAGRTIDWGLTGQVTAFGPGGLP